MAGIIEENEEQGSALTESLLPSRGQPREPPPHPAAADDEDNPTAAAEEGPLSVTKLVGWVLKFFLPDLLPEDISSEDNVNVNVNLNNRVGGLGEEEPEESRTWIDELLNVLVGQLNKCVELSNPDFVKNAILLALSVAALQGSYLSWGYLQETIMTTAFHPTARVPSGRFPSATACVWTNRVVALILSLGVVSWRHGLAGSMFRKTPSHPPLVSFSPCALGNTLSSYCQYAALRYVSFPVLAIVKSGKVVTVMIMGKLLHGRRYAWGEYVEAVLIATGVAIFSCSQQTYYNDGYNAFPLLGYPLMLVFLVCDSFTVQWQEKIYQTYGRRHVDPFQMMLGVNIFGVVLSSLSLVLSGDIGMVVEFLGQNPMATRYLTQTAAVSSLGQICVFFVIREFGPVLFTIVMTIRQMLSIVVSVMVFGHHLSMLAVLGAGLVFGTVASQIRRNYDLARQPELLQT